MNIPTPTDIEEQIKLASYESGKNALINGNYQEAIQLFEEILERDPNYENTDKLLKQAKRQQWLQDNRAKVLMTTGIIIGVVIVLVGAIFWFASSGDSDPLPPSATTVAAVINTTTPTATATKAVINADTPTSPALPPPATTEAIPSPPLSVEPLLPPKNLQISNVTATEAVLQWAASSLDSGQTIIQLDGKSIAELPTDVQNYTLDNLACAQTYQLALFVIDETEQSVPVKIDVTTADCLQPTPNSPTDLTVSNVTTNALTLNWVALSEEGTQVVVQRDGEVIAELPETTHQYAIQDLACGTTVELSVLAVTEAGQSDPSQITAQTMACEAHPTLETMEPLLGKIAVPVFENGMYSIYLASAANDWTPQRLYDRASQPAFTPNSQGLALRSWNHKDWAQSVVILKDYTNIASYRKMTHFVEDAHPNISSQGELVFHRRTPGRTPVIVKMSTLPNAENDPSSQREIAEGENPDWLGDEIIYYASFPQSGLHLMDAGGGNQRLILESQTKLVPNAAPNGEQVAVSIKTDNRWQICVFSASQGQKSLIQITETSNADNYLPTWSPDNNHLVFVSNRDNQWAVWVMQANGTNQRLLFTLPGSIDGTITSPDIDRNLSGGWFEEQLSWTP